MKHAKTAMVALWALATTACSEGIEVSSGLPSQMRVTGGEYLSTDFPVAFEPAPEDASTASADDPDAGDAGAPPPSVVLISSPSSRVPIGTANKAATAFVSPNARTVAVALEGEPGYFRVPVGVESFENSPNLEVKVALTFAPTIQPGLRRIWFAAADEQGDYGYGRYFEVEFVDPAKTAPLAVSLDWSTNMDLDLLVRLPDGSELAPRRYVSAGGDRIASSDDTPSINIDSLAGCAVDGLRKETATFPAPEPGSYEVFVRVNSPCGLPSAGWTLRVLRNGEEIGNASGATYAWEADTKNGGPNGPGRFALRFNVAE